MSGQSSGIPPHFLVIVPGYMGSTLRDRNTGQTVWVDFSSAPVNPLRWDDWIAGLIQSMNWPNDAIEATGILNDVVVVLPWAKQEQYGRLFVALEQMGYRADPARHAERERNVYAFPYDWRQDNRISARQLAEAIERWRDYHPGAQAWIIAHSNGGLVARWYIEKLGGKDRVGRLILMGSPWDGTPKIMRMLFGGIDTLFRRGLNPISIRERTRDLIRTFPSAYQLIPAQGKFLRDTDDQPVNPFADRRWLADPRHHALLEDGLRFNQELGNTLSVDTLCFFGRRRPTTTGGVVQARAGALWSDIDWLTTDAGDGAIPEYSAVNPNAQGRFPFVAAHGDIYVAPPVLEFLRWELIDRYDMGAPKAALTTDRLAVVFEPAQEVVATAEPFGVWATIERNAEQPDPISGATVRVEMRWRQPLPGNPPGQAPASLPASLPKSTLTEVRPGRYEGQLIAPDAPGYYQLRASVWAGDERVALEELVVVE